jgi:hypothetical protein
MLDSGSPYHKSSSTYLQYAGYLLDIIRERLVDCRGFSFAAATSLRCFEVINPHQFYSSLLYIVNIGRLVCLKEKNRNWKCLTQRLL